MKTTAAIIAAAGALAAARAQVPEGTPGYPSYETFPSYGGPGYPTYGDGECNGEISGVFTIHADGRGNPFPGQDIVVDSSCHPEWGDDCDSLTTGDGSATDGRPVIIHNGMKLWLRGNDSFGPIETVPEHCGGGGGEPIGEVSCDEFDTCQLPGSMQYGWTTPTGDFIKFGCLPHFQMCGSDRLPNSSVSYVNNEDVCVTGTYTQSLWERALAGTHGCGVDTNGATLYSHTQKLETEFITPQGEHCERAIEVYRGCLTETGCDAIYGLRMNAPLPDDTIMATCQDLPVDENCQPGDLQNMVQIEEDTSTPGLGGYMSWGGCMPAQWTTGATCVAAHATPDYAALKCVSKTKMTASQVQGMMNHWETQGAVPEEDQTAYQYCPTGYYPAAANNGMNYGIWGGCVSTNECMSMSSPARTVWQAPDNQDFCVTVYNAVSFTQCTSAGEIPFLENGRTDMGCGQAAVCGGGEYLEPETSTTGVSYCIARSDPSLTTCPSGMRPMYYRINGTDYLFDCAPGDDTTCKGINTGGPYAFFDAVANACIYNLNGQPSGE